MERLRDAYARVDVNPLGACALAGTSFDIDRDLTTSLLGFDGGVVINALDATSARDCVQEVVAALAICATNISRMADEIVLWSGHEHALVVVHDSFATGSSIMPQKKNPVVAELARARCGRVFGNLMQLLVITKGIGLGYSCDLQEDKPMTWDTLDSLGATIHLMRQQFRQLTFDGERGSRLCYENFSTATDLANVLVAEHGVPFRHAHEIVGSVVGELVARRQTLHDTDVVRDLLLARGVDIVEVDLARIASPLNSISRSTSAGGTSPDSTVRGIEAIEARLATIRTWTAGRRDRLTQAMQTTYKQAVDLAQGQSTGSSAVGETHTGSGYSGEDCSRVLGWAGHIHRPVLRPIQPRQARQVGLRRPRQRRLPAPLCLDQNCSALPGARTGVTR